MYLLYVCTVHLDSQSVVGVEALWASSLDVLTELPQQQRDPPSTLPNTSTVAAPPQGVPASNPGQKRGREGLVEFEAGLMADEDDDLTADLEGLLGQMPNAPMQTAFGRPKRGRRM
eukprot:888997-Pyramimonas_sp.AAC.1